MWLDRGHLLPSPTSSFSVFDNKKINNKVIVSDTWEKIVWVCVYVCVGRGIRKGSKESEEEIFSLNKADLSSFFMSMI